MKLILFLIIIIIIYYVATKIKVVHIDSLPPNNKNELITRKKLKDVLTTSYIKDDNTSKNLRIESFVNDLEFDTTSVQKPNAHNAYKAYNAYDVLNNIKEEFLDDQYKFNIPNLPQTTRYCTKYTAHIDNKYVEQIKRNINDWNETISIQGIKPIFIIEAGKEFVMKINVSLLYANKTMHLELEYYGQIERSDDFLNGGFDSYILQLVSIKPIKKSEYDINPDAPIAADNNLDINNPFISMREQLEYVDKINKMHLNDN